MHIFIRYCDLFIYIHVHNSCDLQPFRERSGVVPVSYLQLPPEIKPLSDCKSGPGPNYIVSLPSSFHAYSDQYPCQLASSITIEIRAY